LPTKLSSSGYSPQLNNLPEKFHNHREKSLSIEGRVFLKGVPCKKIEYFIDEDKIADVIEIYRLLEYEYGKKEIYAPYPFMYGYNLNEDMEYSENELLMDPKEDDLNGNEKWAVSGEFL